MSRRHHLYPAKIGVALAVASIILYFFFNIWPLAFSIGIAFTNAREDNVFVSPEVLSDYDNAIKCAEFMKNNETIAGIAAQLFAEVNSTLQGLIADLNTTINVVNASSDPSMDPEVASAISSLNSKALRLMLLPGRVSSQLNCSSYNFATSMSIIDPKVIGDLSNIYSIVSDVASTYIIMSKDEILKKLLLAREISERAVGYFSKDFKSYMDGFITQVKALRDSKVMHFNGLENFKKLFTDPRFYYSLYKTLLFVATSVPLKILIGVGLAFLYSSPMIYGRKLMRGLALAPWAIPLLLSGLAWRLLFSPSGELGEAFGIQLFTNEWHAFLVYNLFEAWLAYPFVMTVTMGALSGVAKEIIEAAYIDGASVWQRVRRIMLPLISRPLIVATILTTGASLQAFMVPLLLNGGGPTQMICVSWMGCKTGNVNEMIMLFGYDRAIIDKEWGYAAATYIVVVAIIMTYVALWMYVSRRSER
ncbi:MAG: sugar ABC transporter permease [Desulfurococcus sp.]|nr:sugar ABC transporter permease [Desulfurococcus sp.]